MDIFFVDLTSSFNNRELNFIDAQRYRIMKHRLSVIISWVFQIIWHVKCLYSLMELNGVCEQFWDWKWCLMNDRKCLSWYKATRIFSVSNLFRWLRFNVNIFGVRAWIIFTNNFYWFRLHFSSIVEIYCYRDPFFGCEQLNENFFVLHFLD